MTADHSPSAATPAPTASPPGRRRRIPPAATLLRRSLFVWGLGHIALGDRRGWLLLALQPLAVAVVAAIAVLLVDSTRWIVVFPAVALLIAFWLGQAVHAHRLAVERGAEPGGEMQIAWTLPVVLVVMTTFWLLGGDHGSPAATLHEYVSAWHSGRVAEATSLFVEPPTEEALAARWQAQHEYVRRRVAEAAAMYGAMSGLDPDDPLAGLRYLAMDDEPGGPGRDPGAAVPDEHASVAVDIVRRQRVETTLFGIIPTATQETVLVERAGIIRLRAVPADVPAWLPAGQPPPRVWRIEEVVLPLAPAAASQD